MYKAIEVTGKIQDYKGFNIDNNLLIVGLLLLGAYLITRR